MRFFSLGHGSLASVHMLCSTPRGPSWHGSPRGARPQLHEVHAPKKFHTHEEQADLPLRTPHHYVQMLAQEPARKFLGGRAKRGVPLLSLLSAGVQGRPPPTDGGARRTNMNYAKILVGADSTSTLLPPHHPPAAHGPLTQALSGCSSLEALECLLPYLKTNIY